MIADLDCAGKVGCHKVVWKSSGLLTMPPAKQAGPWFSMMKRKFGAQS
jgi:hypothetical protein